MKGTIVGNIGKDAILKTLDSGTQICNFSVADSVGYGDKKKTQWVQCSLFGKRAESLNQYLLKGVKVVVFGDVSVREYSDANGCSRFSIDCAVSDVILNGKSEAKDDAPPAPASKYTEDNIPF